MRPLMKTGPMSRRVMPSKIASGTCAKTVDPEVAEQQQNGAANEHKHLERKNRRLV